MKLLKAFVVTVNGEHFGFNHEWEQLTFVSQVKWAEPESKLSYSEHKVDVFDQAFAAGEEVEPVAGYRELVVVRNEETVYVDTDYANMVRDFVQRKT